MKIILIGIIVTVIGLFALSGVDKFANSNNNGHSGITDVDQNNTIKIDIDGEVNHPGEYIMYSTDTLGDLIQKAGGTTNDADDRAYNSSLQVGTRTSFYIAPLSDSDGICVGSELVKVNINTAEEEKLLDVGFNSAQAPALIDYRYNTGLFEALEDILNVKGIGQATFEKVKDKIILL